MITWRYETHLKYSIPKDKFSLANAFTLLQAMCDRGEIKDFGISQATLEQVWNFINTNLYQIVNCYFRYLSSLQNCKVMKKTKNKYINVL